MKSSWRWVRKSAETDDHARSLVLATLNEAIETLEAADDVRSALQQLYRLRRQVK